MFESKINQYIIEVNLYGQPITKPEIEQQRKKLTSIYRTYLNYILAIFVLGVAVTYRALSLDFDSDYQLFKVSLTIGLWFGLFTGLMIDGDSRRKLQMIIVAIIVSASAGLFASMLVTLYIGTTTNWITSVNILASALGSMWILTSYDEVLKGFDSIKSVNKRQLHYIAKAASYFIEMNRFKDKISSVGREPVAAEYWAMRDWIRSKIDKKDS